MDKTLPLLSESELIAGAGAGNASRAEGGGFGGLTTPRGPLPLKAMEVKTRIDALIARTEVRQTYVNNLGEPLEATYIFPLPDRAAVIDFRLEVAGRVIDGLLKEREEARSEYAQAIEAGHRAAITEEERSSVFSLRVGNVLAGEVAVVHLTMTAPLTCRDCEAELRFPLVVAPRYIPGVPLDGESVGDGVAPDTDAVPDASRITPPLLLEGYPSPVHLSIEVSLNPCGLPVGDVRSSLHAVAVEDGAGGSRTIRLRTGDRLNRDFILRFRFGADAMRTSLVVEADEGGGGKLGTFLLTIVPPATSHGLVKPRDIIFILDRSGSMAGWKLTAARRSVERMIETLREGDRFNVYAFGNTVKVPGGFDPGCLSPGSVRCRAGAAAFLASLEAKGGTEMAKPLILAMKTLNSSPRAGERERVIVLVTDGQVGNEDQLLREAASGIENTRIFALGIDTAVNEGFLKKLATSGGGMWEMVESESRLDEAMDRIHRLVASPVMTDLRIESDGFEIEAGSIVPARLPGLFHGVPILIQGRWKGKARGSLSLTARTDDGKAWSQEVPGSVASSGAAASVWARGRIRDLEDRHAVAVEGAHRDEIAEQILDTSLRFRVLSRFTAYVAVDRSEIANPGGQAHRILQPVEMPLGWEEIDMEMEGACSADFGPRMFHWVHASERALPYSGLCSLDDDSGSFQRIEKTSSSEVVDAIFEKWESLSRLGFNPRGSLKRLNTLLASFVKILEGHPYPEDRIQPFRELLTRAIRGLGKRIITRAEVKDLWKAWKDLLVVFRREEDAAFRPEG